MSIATTAPSTVQIRRGRLVWLIVGVAAVAAAITWALVAVAFDSGSSTVKSSSSASRPAPNRSATAHAAATKALQARSEALNREYGLGAAGIAAAKKALQARSEELNREYGLGAAGAAAARQAPKVPSLFELTPARLAAGALGTGYQLPVKQSGPTLASVLASMSPQTRRWTKAVTGLTFAQLAAGAAGSP
jgi:hypothetical protein